MVKNRIKEGDIINECTVIELYLVSNYGKSKAKIKCNICGRERIIAVKNLLRKNGGKTTFHKFCSNHIIKDEFYKSFKSSWSNMRTRTENDNYEKYNKYKGRGINSDEFKYFIDFYDKMFSSFVEHANIYGINNTTLERIDVNGNYSKSNCKWETWYNQANNKTSNLTIYAYDENNSEIIIHNLKRFCDVNGYNYPTIISNIHAARKKGRSFYKNIQSKLKFRV